MEAPLLKESYKRILPDRRKHPTPMLSRYTFFGRRTGFRRKADRERGGYIDRYHPALLFLLLLIAGLNGLDSAFTVTILDRGGMEFNPVVRSVMESYGDRFWIWKFALVSVCLVLLCLHVKFKRTQVLMIGACSIFVALLSYEICLILYCE